MASDSGSDARSSSGDFHTMPLDDLLEHQFHDCPCGPATEPVKREDGSVGWLVLHHSFDGREFSESDYAGPPMPKEGSVDDEIDRVKETEGLRDALRDQDSQSAHVVADALDAALAALTDNTPPDDRTAADIVDAFNWRYYGIKPPSFPGMPAEDAIVDAPASYTAEPPTRSPGMTDALDPAAIMAEHERLGHATCAVCDDDDWPCLPYRMAAELAAMREREQRAEQVAVEVEDWGRALRDQPGLCEHQRNQVESFTVGRDLMAHMQRLRAALGVRYFPEEFHPDWEAA